MSSVDQMTGQSEQAKARQRSQGRVSLWLGTAATAMLVCPLLPAPVPTWVRFLPVYFIVPLGIAAIVSGLVALRRMRNKEGADPFWARAGIAFGTVAVVLPLAVLVWAFWALSQAYD
ncbi:hypothetical protein ABZ626_22660 [Streptomyces longispororuber]|uniref:hypothetical protein n=1 Tax=Streptomyces longispororuber TaxID=68230 RepID=UPI0033C10C1C